MGKPDRGADKLRLEMALGCYGGNAEGEKWPASEVAVQEAEYGTSQMDVESGLSSGTSPWFLLEQIVNGTPREEGFLAWGRRRVRSYSLPCGHWQVCGPKRRCKCGYCQHIALLSFPSVAVNHILVLHFPHKLCHMSFKCLLPAFLVTSMGLVRLWGAHFILILTTI
jgi:hypothetical protein